LGYPRARPAATGWAFFLLALALSVVQKYSRRCSSGQVFCPPRNRPPSAACGVPGISVPLREAAATAGLEPARRHRMAVGAPRRLGSDPVTRGAQPIRVWPG